MKGQLKIIAAHTDSPCLRVKPISKKGPREGFLQVGVETYGGGLWHTWFDRDISVAGKIIVNEGTVNNPHLKEYLVDAKKSILRIPSLAIHLDRSINEGFKFNNETNLTPIICTDSKRCAETEEISSGFIASHSCELLEAVCMKSEKSPRQVVNLDLCLYDTQAAAISGVHDEFIHSARLDNLFMSFCTLQSLIESVESGMDGFGIRTAILFDHEEIGSQSAQGADSSIVEVILRRIITSLEPNLCIIDAFARIISRSILVSADMAHAVHPNYPDKHDECHRPRMHKGLVIKYNSNQRYATSARSAAYFKTLAAGANVPIQEFMVRNDSPCGSTIGPILSSKLGIPAIDVGVAQLSMHSIREMAGVDDISHSINLFSAFFTQCPIEFIFHNP